MLDFISVFTKGGALLWTLQLTSALKHSPVEALNALIRTCLLEERSGGSAFTFTPKAGPAQALKWTFHNGLGLVFVVAYQKALSLLYVEDLLAAVRDEFVGQYRPGVPASKYDSFSDTFRRLMREAESKADEAKRGAQRNAAAGKALKGVREGGTGGAAAGQRSSSQDDADEADDDKGSGGARGSSADGDNGDEEEDGTATLTGHQQAFDVTKLPKGAARGRGGRGMRGGRRRTTDELKDKEKEKADKEKEKAPAKKKSARNWSVMGTNGGGEDAELDYSNKAEVNGGPASVLALPVGPSGMDEEEPSEDSLDGELEELEEEALRKGPTKDAAPVKRGLLSSFLNSVALSVVGKASLSVEDLEVPLAGMKRKLMERNVAEEIAQQICDSVASSLEGQKLSSLTGLSAFVRRAFEDSLSGILNKRSVDVLLDIKRTRAKGVPYVIVFCGVNGVGKSTNLAKICYWLKQHNVSALIAACDTFRAGAVEQLKTHCTRLQVPLYERGYEKDPAKVAAEGIKQAQREGIDCVLVDTAGRMQDNEPLMRALSNLIHVNQPNLLLFVGEALVGNDAVDQLVKFNRALYDLAPQGDTKRRLIDGIVLTKFDTIDDKVGAALSMVYTSGAPIMFVGCGQTYLDLKRLNVKSVVNSLLS